MTGAAVLFTGGKDSVYALHKAIWSGLNVKALASIIPHYKYSMLYHQPNYTVLMAQAYALKIPLETIGLYDPRKEEEALRELLCRIRDSYGVRVVVMGGIKSAFQKNAFSRVAEAIGLELYAPNWGVEEKEYMKELLDHDIEFTLISITSMGIPHNLLGRTITRSELDELTKLSIKYGFNLSFEGGEAETVVINAPLFKYRLAVYGRVLEISEYEGYFEIKKVSVCKK